MIGGEMRFLMLRGAISSIRAVAVRREKRSFNSHPYWPVNVRFPDTKMQFLHRQNASFSLLYYSPVCSF